MIVHGLFGSLFFVTAVLSPHSYQASESPSGRTTPAIASYQVAPTYPKEALRAGVQGVVTFRAVINRDGRLKDLNLIEDGPLLVDASKDTALTWRLLINAAKDSALKWRYKPARRNGMPVEENTTISIQFTADGQVSTRDNEHSGRTPDEKDEQLLPEGVVKMDKDVTAPRLVYGPDPRYTERALNAREQGTVLLRLVVTKEGTTRDIEVGQFDKGLGSDLLENAVEVAGTWRFAPAIKNGQPVAVRLNIEVKFHLR